MFESKYLINIKPYKLSSHRAWELASDHKVLKLDWNEATISPSPLVFERIGEALSSQQLNWYPDVDNKTLLYKIAQYSKVGLEKVQYFPSSDSIHEYIIRAYIEPGDKIIICSPTYDNFRAVAESGGGEIIYLRLDNELKLNTSLLQDTINAYNPKIVYIVNPNNPTGSFVKSQELFNLIHNNYKSLFIVDEAYFEFYGESMASSIDKYDNVIITRTFSKAFALASFRIGYIISNCKNISTLNKIRNAKNISLFSQIAAEAALDSISYTMDYVNEVVKAREIFAKRLSYFADFKVFDSYANFLFIEVSSREVKYEIIRFLENKKIFIRDYAHVAGYENFIRISIGTVKQMDYVYNVISEYYKFTNKEHEVKANKEGCSQYIINESILKN